MVELRTGTIWEVPKIYWKSIPGCWTNHRKRTFLHCRREGEWVHQITLDRRPQCTTACTRRERAAELAQIGGRPARQSDISFHQHPVQHHLSWSSLLPFS